MTEYQKAKAWREARGLSVKQLAEMTGYGPRTIYWLELGLSPPNGMRAKAARVKPWIWQRYRMMCGGVEAELQSGEKFNWEG